MVAAVAAAFVLVAMAGLVTVTGADEANASTWIYQSGSTGYFEIGKVWTGKIYDAQYQGNLVSVTVSGPVVWPTGAARTEIVTVYTYAYIWTTQGWLQVDGGRVAQGISHGDSMYFSNSATFNLHPGFYYIAQYINWSGTNGWAGVIYNQPSDFICNSNASVYPLCAPSYDGWFQVYGAHPYL
jgi:hypothetical protein